MPPTPPSPTASATPGAQLFRAACDDAPGAWSALVERYRRLVWTVPIEMGLVEADGEDVFQATWASLYENRHLIRDPRALPAWLTLTARRHALRRLRERPTAPEHEAWEREAPDDPVADAALLERRALVHAALGELRPRCRELLQGLYLDGRRRSYESVARELDCPAGSIGPTRLRCLAQLLRALERRGLRAPGDVR